MVSGQTVEAQQGGQELNDGLQPKKRTKLDTVRFAENHNNYAALSRLSFRRSDATEDWTVCFQQVSWTKVDTLAV